MAESKAAPAAGGEKKGGKGVIIAAAALAVVGLGGGGAFFFLGQGASHAAPAPAASASSGEEPVGETDSFNPIVVDVRDAEGAVHHLKVVLAVEIAVGKKKEELEKYKPRAREAAITFLRALEFERATDPKEFTKVSEELAKVVQEALGGHSSRVLITDYVAQ